MMTTKLFGTDGIRGTANRGNMTAEVALKVGMAAALQFRNGDHRNRVVIGKDTRLSGYLLEPALTAGFISMGMDVILVGPMPTPAIAMLTRSLRADLGVMISASHNPFQDNGIKLFGPDGYKLSDAVEAEIEANVADGMSKNMIAPSKLGRAKRLYDAGGRYTEFVKRTFPRGQTLDGLKIVIDCANGAAYKVAPEVLWELGAEVIPVGVDPDGYNINKGCGSTDTDYMCSQVVSHGADIGIALDGDADRLMVCDEQGAMVDGDQIMALIAKNWLDRDLLKGGGLVATVMSNLGLEKYLNSIGLNLERTKVGDRYVVDHMRANGFNIGGEQSGHIVLGEHLTTGDGLVAALQILAVVVASDGPASKVTRLFDPLPQLLKNVRYGIGQPLEDTLVKNAIKEGEARLSDTGRVLIRKSGTEAMIRVMAEGEDESLILSVVDNIVSAVEHAAS
ncbi:MAG: phosphoglucosamine mutase [Rhodospirillales bacterium]